MDRCPCVSLRHGVFVVALAAYVAVQSKSFFGWSAFHIVTVAHNGNLLAFLICSVWVCVALAGLVLSVMGYRATLTHYDAVNGASAMWSSGVVALCVFLLQNVLSPAPAEAAATLFYEVARAFAVAWLMGNVANLYLQLRGLFPGKLPLRQPAQSFGGAVNTVREGELRALVGRLQAALEQVTEDRNRLAYDASRKPQIAADIEAVLQFPGVRRAVFAVLHPDKAKSEAERPQRTQLFQTASAVFDRIGVQ